jgi:hypothetical protein
MKLSPVCSLGILEITQDPLRYHVLNAWLVIKPSADTTQYVLDSISGNRTL